MRCHNISTMYPFAFMPAALRNKRRGMTRWDCHADQYKIWKKISKIINNFNQEFFRRKCVRQSSSLLLSRFLTGTVHDLRRVVENDTNLNKAASLKRHCSL